MLGNFFKKKHEKMHNHRQSTQPREGLFLKACELANQKHLDKLRDFLQRHASELLTGENLARFLRYLAVKNYVAVAKMLVDICKVNAAEVGIAFVENEKYEAAKLIVEKYLQLEEFFRVACIRKLNVKLLLNFIAAHKEKKHYLYQIMLLQTYASFGDEAAVNIIISQVKDEEKAHSLKVLAAGIYAKDGFPGYVRNLVTWEENKATRHDMLMEATISYSRVKEYPQISHFLIDDFDDDHGEAVAKLATKMFLTLNDRAGIYYLLSYSKKEIHAPLYSLIAEHLIEDHISAYGWLEFLENKFGEKVKHSILALTLNTAVPTSKPRTVFVAHDAHIRDQKNQIDQLAPTHNMAALYAIFNQGNDDEQLTLKKYYANLICKDDKNPTNFINSFLVAEQNPIHKVEIKLQLITKLMKLNKRIEAKSIVDTASSLEQKCEFHKKYLNFMWPQSLNDAAEYIASINEENKERYWIWLGRVFAASNNIAFLNDMYNFKPDDDFFSMDRWTTPKTFLFRSEISSQLNQSGHIPGDRFKFIDYIMKFDDPELRIRLYGLRQFVTDNYQSKRSLIKLKQFDNVKQALASNKMTTADANRRIHTIRNRNITQADLFLQEAEQLYHLVKTYGITYEKATSLCFMLLFTDFDWLLTRRPSIPEDKTTPDRKTNWSKTHSTPWNDLFPFLHLPDMIYFKITSYILGFSELKTQEIRQEYLNVVPEYLCRHSLFKLRGIGNTKLLYTQQLTTTEKSSSDEVNTCERYQSRINSMSS